jgi:hypothetical protein
MNFDLGDAVSEVLRVYDAMPAEARVVDLEQHRERKSA